MNRELERLVSMFPAAELNDPTTTHKKLAELSARATAPDIKGID